jgi:hypothetical protein
MRFTVTHYRILLLTVNLLLGLGVPAFAGYRYFLMTKHPDSSVVVVDLKKFEPRDDGVVAVQDSASKIAIASTWLEPKAALPPDKPTDTPADQGKSKEDGASDKNNGELQPGKLGDDGWYYYSSILREDPQNNFVVLRKKDPSSSGIPSPGGTAGSIRANPRLKAVTGTRPAPRSTSKTGKIAQQVGDRVSFFVHDRRYTNEELGLDFLIFSVDEKEFVYMLPDNNKKKYALRYHSESAYETHPEEGIQPPPKTPDEMEGAAEEKKPKLIHRDSKDFELQNEKQFQGWLRGEINLAPASTTGEGDGSRTIKPTANGATPAIPTPGSQGATPSKLPASKSAAPPRGPRKPTAEESKQLDSTLKSLPPAAQKELIEGLKGANAPK